MQPDPSARTPDNAAGPVTVDLSRARAVIWDMDDTLARTSTRWVAAETATMRAAGQEWSPELAQRYKGMNALDVATVMYNALKPANLSLEQMKQTMRSALIDAFHRDPPPEMLGAAAAVRAMAGKRRLALASGSPLELIEFTLGKLDLRDAFEIVISSESVTRGKPHPDVFLAAAELLKVPAADCFVLEDSLVGVQAAEAAGMPCLAIPSLLAATPAIAAIATVVAPSLDQVRFTF